MDSANSREDRNAAFGTNEQFCTKSVSFQMIKDRYDASRPAQMLNTDCDFSKSDDNRNLLVYSNKCDVCCFCRLYELEIQVNGQYQKAVTGNI